MSGPKTANKVIDKMNMDQCSESMKRQIACNGGDRSRGSALLALGCVPALLWCPLGCPRSRVSML